MTLGAGDYTIEDTSYWSERVLTHVFRHLNQHDVMLEGILMKPSMCLPGMTDTNEGLTLLSSRYRSS